MLASSEHSRPRPLLWPVLDQQGKIGECGMALRRCMDGVRGTPPSCPLGPALIADRRRWICAVLCVVCVYCIN